MLSPDQFDRVLERKLEDEGGFTTHVPTQSFPRTGIMVAQHGAEERVAGATAREIGQYRRDNSDELFADAAHMGGWRSGDADYLDVSRAFVRADEAHEYGRRNAQIATYDLGEDKERAVHYGPPVPPLDVANPLEEHRSATAKKNAAYRGLVRQHLKARGAPSTEEQMVRARQLGDAVYNAEQLHKRLTTRGTP